MPIDILKIATVKNHLLRARPLERYNKNTSKI